MSIDTYDLKIILQLSHEYDILLCKSEVAELVGKRIRELRTALHLSQTEFGRKLSVSRDVIGSIEYDRVKPKEVLLELMCHVFSVSKDWLITGEGDMFDTQKNMEIAEAMKILDTLSPSFRTLALRQLREMLSFQNTEEQKPD